MLKQGMQVKIVTPTITGTIVGGTFVDGSPQYLVEYADADGEIHQRYCAEESLQEVPVPAVE